MTDEVKTEVKDPNKGTPIPGEASEASASPREQQEIALKEKAKTLGWKPLKEYDGDPSDWVSAREFVARQSFFDKIKTQSNEIRSLRDDIKLMSQHFSQMKEVEYKRALAELKAERKDAISEGDSAKAESVNEQIVEIEAARKVAAQQPKGAVGQVEFEQFKERNKWYNTDAELTERANVVGMGYAQMHPNATPQQVLDYVEKEVKKTMKAKVVAPSSPEGGGITKGDKGRSGKLSKGDLNDMQLRMMKTFVERGVLTEDQYLDQLSVKEGNRA